MDGEKEVVISGISGRFPECNNVDELKEALLKGVDLITEDDRRYPTAIKGFPHRLGKIPEIDKFDASFFGVHTKQAACMDPRHRILLETVCEAIIDGGFNPAEIRGSKTGVFVGLSTFTNYEEMRRSETNGYLNFGIAPYCASNRISHAFDFKGPSITLDTACSSAMYAVDIAFQKLKLGEIENAIVCGTHLVLHPKETEEYNTLNMLSQDGICRVFSKNRSGYVRSEAVSCAFLQIKGNSRRVYATILGSKTNFDGYTKEGFTFPSMNTQLKLMKEIYSEFNINPNKVTYMETHGTGTPVGDAIECEAIANMFSNDRKEPLLIGSVKSNLGHSEMTSGLVSITKALISFEVGSVPASIFTDPIDTNISGIKEGTLKVVTENTDLKDGLIAINSFGIGGTNAHVVLKPNDKILKPTADQKHRLVQVSGRTEEAVTYFLNEIENNKNDEEFLGLIDEIHKINLEGHIYRGYTTLGENPVRNVTKYNPTKRPIVFIYSGMGSQWPGMGRDFMKFKVFQDSFNRSVEALKPFGVDLNNVIMSGTEDSLKDLTNTFSAITAISVALTDLLYSLGIKPDLFAGHSLGEIGCAYANGDLTPEQATLLAYGRGYAIKQQELPPGQMAAIGLSKEEIVKILPEDVFIGCQNSKDNVTISGAAESTINFVKNLHDQGIFARLVNTGGYAYHSKYLLDSHKHLLEFCRRMLTDPKPRSVKWISSSVPPEQAKEHWATHNGPEYHTNNYKNKVLFDQIYEHIPKNAIVIEISPNGILQSILKREMGPENTLLTLTKRNVEDHEQFLLSSIGKIFAAGAQPNLRNLYMETVFPVSRGTKMIAPLVKWDHSTTWFVPYWTNKDYFGHAIKFSLSEQQYTYLKGHNVDGRTIMPAAGYLEMVWKIFALKALKDQSELPIVIENVKFLRATVLSQSETVEFLINIMKETGYFEISEGSSLVVTGTVRMPKDVSNEFKSSQRLHKIDNSLPICTKDDFYKETQLKRLMYSGVLKGVVQSDINGYNSIVEWMQNFTGFLDCLIQLSLADERQKGLVLPSNIKKLVIDPMVHLKEVYDNKFVAVKRDPCLNIVRTKGIEMTGIEFKKAPKREKTQAEPTLESYEFIKYDSTNNIYDAEKSFIIALQIILQNAKGLLKRVTLCEIKEDGCEIHEDIRKKIIKIAEKQVLAEVDLVTKTFDDINFTCDALLINENVTNKFGFKHVIKKLKENEGFLIHIGQVCNQELDDLDIAFRSNCLTLLKPVRFPLTYDVVNIRQADFKWLNKLKTTANVTENKVIFMFSQKEETSGVIGLSKCLNAESTNVDFNAVLTDNRAEIFSVDDEFYREQLSKKLSINVLKGNDWGTFVHLPIQDIKPKMVSNATVSVQTLGDLSSIRWIEKPTITLKDQQSYEIVNVRYTGLNSRDIQIATSKVILPKVIPTDSESDLGFEYSGVTQKGKRVMGIISRGALSLQAKTDPDLTWEIPDSWSLEQAATVPVFYSMCYYAMVVRGHIEQEESILIHAPQGIGMAAVSIALSFKANIFMTVNTQEEKQLANKLLPQIYVGLVQDPSFLDLIREKTGSKGLDLILIAVDDNFFDKSMSSLSDGARILDLSKIDYTETTMIDSRLVSEYSYHRVTFDVLLKQSPTIKNKLKTLVTEGILQGTVSPLPSIVFNDKDIVSAFKLLASETSKEKVLIKVGNDKTPSIAAIPKVFFDPNKVYIIIGGLGGIGLELTDWLLTRNATKIILNTRRNIWNGYQAICMEKWSFFKDVVVKVDLSDATMLNGAEKLIQRAQTLGPVGGIFNLALVLKDAIIFNQTEENFEAVFKSKIRISENLDLVTRKICPLLDHFILFSSVASGRGNKGQSNYGMANSAMENLCEKRRGEKLPGLAVQWGPVADVGTVGNNSEQEEYLNMIPQRINSCFDALEKFMLHNVIVGSSVIVPDKKKSKMAAVLVKSPVNVVAQILGISNIDSIDKSKTLSQLGLDSLIITEIKQTLYRNFKLEFGLEEIRNLTFGYLSEIKFEKSKIDTSASDKNTISGTLPPVLSNGVPIVKINDYEKKPHILNIFIVTPIEGYIDCFEPLAKNLNAAVFALQFTKNNNFQSIKETAKYFIGVIKNNQRDGAYVICGYSIGAIIAFEISLQLEKEGKQVRLIIIDGSPEFMKPQGSDSIETQNKILTTFTTFFKNVDQEKVKFVLRNFTNFEEILNPISKLISEAIGSNIQEVKHAAEEYWKICKIASNYTPDEKFKGDVLLIRRAYNPQDLSDDYELQKDCVQIIQVEKIDVDDYTILFGENLILMSKIINEWIKK